MSRILKRLRTHGLIKKIGHTYKYYVTAFGKGVATTALKLRELVIIPQLASAPRDNFVFLTENVTILLDRF